MQSETMPVCSDLVIQSGSCQKLANLFASCELPTAEALIAKFNSLDRTAQAQSRLVSGACKALGSSWDELTPTLDMMQSLLSQRGVSREMLREANLPGWSEWWKTFQANSGISVTLRAIEKRLKKYRRTDEAPVRPKAKIKMSSHQQQQALAALDAANKLVAALRSGMDYEEALHDYIHIAIKPARIAQLRAGLRDAEESSDDSTPDVLED